MEQINSTDLADIINLWEDLPPDYREWFAMKYLSPATCRRLLESKGVPIVPIV